jgi:hypothetical protein
MGEVTGGIYRGAKQGPFKWTCPKCGTEQVSRFEDGCPSCGAGTQAQNDRALDAARVRTGVVTDDDLSAAVSVDGLGGVREMALTLSPTARRTLVNALGYYAAQATRTPDDLALTVIVAWAQALEMD